MEWGDQLKLGKSSAFVKRNLRRLPSTEAAFEADFFLDATSARKRFQRWMGIVVEREFGGVPAMEEARLGPPTVNDLASLLAHAMLRPSSGEDHQRPRTIYLRDRPQWQELLPHLRQLRIEVVLCEDLPEFDEAVIDWMQRMRAERQLSADEIKAALRQPFSKRKPSWFTKAMDLMKWTEMMVKGAYPSRQDTAASHGPMRVVPIPLSADELGMILTKTTIAKTKKLRPRLEAAVEGEAIELTVGDWSRVLLTLCGTTEKGPLLQRRSLEIACRIGNELAKTLGIDAPELQT